MQVREGMKFICGALAAAALPLAGEVVMTVNTVEELGFKKGTTENAYRTDDGVIHLKGDQRPWSAGTFVIDPAATYTLSGEFRAAPGTEPATLYFGFTQFNRGRLINSPPVNAITGTQTTLVKDVAKTDTEITIASVKGWKSGQGTFAVIGAKPDYSDLPNYVFTKPAITNIVRKADGAATLQFSKAVGVEGKAGEGVRQHEHGGNYHYAGCWNVPAPQEWKRIEGKVKGHSLFGLAYDKWWHGAETAGILLLANYRGNQESHLEIRNLKVEKSDHPAVEYARSEFAALWKRVTGNDAPAAHIGCVGDVMLPDGNSKLSDGIKNDGYVLYGDGKELWIVARKPRGCVYGVYDFFRRFAGARWFYPGKEGERIAEKADLKIGEFAILDNPSFEYRQFNLVSSYGMHETIDWMVKNRLQPPVGKIRQALHYLPKGVERYDYRRYDAPEEVGGHVFSSLLDDKLFAEHPEYFAEVKGKRIPQKDEKREWQAQPCSSNAEGLKVMGEAVAKMVTAKPGVERLLILNNDCGGWCRCAECKSCFGDSEADRFWALANNLADYAMRAKPGIMVDVHGYQTFQEPPPNVKPLKGVSVNVCVHHRCYVHAIGDKRCPFNERYRKMILAWRKLIPETVGTYEYTNCMPGWGYLPIERVVYDDIAWYAGQGLTKYIDEVLPLDGISQGKPIPETPYRGYLIPHYIQACALWNPDLDFDKLMGETCDFVYGSGSEAMKRYRTMLRAGYERSGLYLGYGAKDDELWRVIATDEVVESLTNALAQAQAAVKDDPARKKQVDFEAQRFGEVFLATLPNKAKTHRKIIDGYPERVLNGDFEYGIEGWGKSGGGEVMEGDAPSGRKYFSAESGSSTIYQAPAMSFQTYVPAPLCDKIKIKAYFKGKGKPTFSLRLNDRSTNTPPVGVDVDTPEWKQFEIDIDTSKYDRPMLYLFIAVPKGMCMDAVELIPYTGKGDYGSQ